MSVVSPPPWEGQDLGYGARLGLLLLSVLLLIVAIVSFFIVFGVSAGIARGTTDPDRVTSNIITAVVSALVCIASIAGLVVIWPRTRGPARFMPSYGTIAPTTSGHPFEVRFQRQLWGRSLSGTGTAQFTPEGLALTGTLEPHPLFQLAIVLLVTVLPLVIFGFGLGIIPALILAYFLGRKKVTLNLPYTSLHDVAVKRRQLTLRTSQVPPVITLGVATVDGERLYRELQPRFPQAVTTHFS